MQDDRQCDAATADQRRPTILFDFAVANRGTVFFCAAAARKARRAEPVAFCFFPAVAVLDAVFLAPVPAVRPDASVFFTGTGFAADVGADFLAALRDFASLRMTSGS